MFMLAFYDFENSGSLNCNHLMEVGVSGDFYANGIVLGFGIQMLETIDRFHEGDRR